MATIASQDSYVNLTTSYWAKNDSIGGQSTFSTVTISTANIDNATIADINNLFLSTQIIQAEEAFVSSISTFGIYLDGSVLTTAGPDLLLNGVPIATTSNISSLADWSYDPAISTLNMNGNSSINGALTSTSIIHAGSGLITNLVCNDISTTTLTVISTVQEISTISSLTIDAQVGIFSTFIGNNGSLSSLSISTINDVVFPQVFNTVSSFNTASVSSLTASTINGVEFPGTAGNASQWATFPAVSTIYGGGGATDDLNLVATRFLNANAAGVNVVVDEGVNIAAPASFSVIAQNGNRGNISLTANPGFGGVFGQIGLTANGGTVLGVGTGGLIELTANTPAGTLSNATSAIKFSAAGINSYAGAVPSVGSLLGYNFIYGTLGVNLCAGLPSIVPNTPGTTYIYGTNGVTIGSQLDTTSDIVQGAGGIYTTLLTGYWAGGLLSPQNLLIRGRQIPIIGNSFVSISNVDVLSFDAGASGAITGVQTINGSAYPPSAPPIPSNLTVSTLLAGQYVSTPSLIVSTINGVEYVPGGVSPDLIVSTLVASTSVSTPELLVSSINGVEYIPGGVSPDLIVSTLVASTSVSTQELFLSSINGAEYVPGGIPGDLYISTLSAAFGVSTPSLYVSTINNAAYPPEVVISPDLIVSTVVASTNISTPELLVSSINGVEYIPGGVTPDLIVSTLVASTSVSTPELYVSSVNGVSYPTLILSSLVTSSFVSTIDLRVSTINGQDIVRPNVSSLNIAGVNPALGADFEAGLHLNSQMYFQGNNASNVNQGVMMLRRTTGFYADPNLNTFPALTVDAFSTLSATLPIICASVYVNGGGSGSTVTPISGDSAGNIVFPFSTIVGISTINGASYPAPAFVSPNLVVSTLQASVSVSTASLYISSINGGVYPPPNASSPNGEFSTIVVSSFVNTLAVNTSSITANEMTVSSIQFGGAISTTCFIYPTGGTSADLQITLGEAGSTGNGALRVYNNASFGGGGIIDVEDIMGLSSITGRAGADINLLHAGGGHAVSIYDTTTGDFGILQVGIVTQISSISGLDASFITSAASTLSVSTINGAPVVSLPYTLSGTTANATISNRGTGSGNSLTTNVFTLISQITFNIPADWLPGYSVYYDGWILSDFDANFNSFWGVSYFTNTNPTPTDLIGSTSVTANALNYSNIQQIYLTTNLIIPPTYLAPGGTITLTIYCSATSANHYLTIAPVNQARIGLVKD